jgi:hypothetical protein
MSKIKTSPFGMDVELDDDPKWPWPEGPIPAASPWNYDLSQAPDNDEFLVLFWDGAWGTAVLDDVNFDKNIVAWAEVIPPSEIGARREKP